MLTRIPRPSRLWAILDESDIRRIVGALRIMKEQLGRLLEANESPTITLQVLPLPHEAHAAALVSFVNTGGTGSRPRRGVRRLPHRLALPGEG
ncbi:Scr1 family TA system antitoxin-like transcriptional regulator [Streptomyces sp. NPDC094468]|uniref:Scr1 family TA system antitoxin-like transcriptional regulator n=1 Tax=Streptomyces sp. NPDC094468 TaxID=3366066 RepID=UPI00382E2AB0